ncbi:DUF167 family protein [Woodsholea maritima]|uniref:DUF167 family protein n=1 Tax=Woodsholea maritima TaxID=240237 RepID=UPI0003807341|nr:DUF167 family protein [Woodsholea maritima]
MVYERLDEGIRLFVRVTPKANKDQIEGQGQDDQGRAHLKVKVRAIPDKGLANQAVEKLLSKQLGVSKTQITLTQGSTARVKTFFISMASSDQDVLITTLDRLCSGETL